MGALFFLRRPQTIIIFPMRYSSLILLCLLFNFAFTQYYSCSGPCTTRFPQCQEAKCDHALGVCITEPLDPLPAGCCVSSDDCVSQNPECLVGSCSITTNQCSFDNVCDPPSIFTYGECSRNADCTDDNECTQEFCDTTNGVCVISSIPNSNIPGCCQDRSIVHHQNVELHHVIMIHLPVLIELIQIVMLILEIITNQLMVKKVVVVQVPLQFLMDKMTKNHMDHHHILWVL